MALSLCCVIIRDSAPISRWCWTKSWVLARCPIAILAIGACSTWVQMISSLHSSSTWFLNP